MLCVTAVADVAAGGGRKRRASARTASSTATTHGTLISASVGQYSQFTIAGAAIGVVAPAFAEWHKAFWDNLATSIKIHGIETVIAIDHRDCGAARIAYGDASIATPEVETETHRAAMAEFRKEVGERQPQLKIETILMALDGSIVVFT